MYGHGHHNGTMRKAGPDSIIISNCDEPRNWITIVIVLLGRSGYSLGLAPVQRYFGRAFFISISAVEAVKVQSDVQNVDLEGDR
jgi:hypothetical protein